MGTNPGQIVEGDETFSLRPLEQVSEGGYLADDFDASKDLGYSSSETLSELVKASRIVQVGGNYAAAEYLLWHSLTKGKKIWEQRRILSEVERLYALSDQPFSAAIAANLRGDKDEVVRLYDESCIPLFGEDLLPLYKHVLMAGDFERRKNLIREWDLPAMDMSNLVTYINGSRERFEEALEAARRQDFVTKEIRAPVLHALKDHLFAQTYSTLRGHFMRKRRASSTR